jgi:hypothetical protein
MARVLHLLKGDDPALALVVIAQQQAAGDEIGVALLPGTPTPTLPAGVSLQRVPDELGWDALLERIFEADQVITW